MLTAISGELQAPGPVLQGQVVSVRVREQPVLRLPGLEPLASGHQRV
jgi:hypothetical protein